MNASRTSTRRRAMLAISRATLLPAALLGFGTTGMAQPTGSPLVGIWRITGWEARDTAGQVQKFYGDKPGGYYVFSAGGRFLFIMVGSNRPPLPPGAISDATAARLYATMSALDGKYTVTGDNRFVVHVEESSNQYWTGTDQVRDFKIVGSTLVITFPTKTAKGDELLVTVTSERVE